MDAWIQLLSCPFLMAFFSLSKCCSWTSPSWRFNTIFWFNIKCKIDCVFLCSFSETSVRILLLKLQCLKIPIVSARFVCLTFRLSCFCRFYGFLLTSCLSHQDGFVKWSFELVIHYFCFENFVLCRSKNLIFFATNRVRNAEIGNFSVLLLLLVDLYDQLGCDEPERVSFFRLVCSIEPWKYGRPQKPHWSWSDPTKCYFHFKTYLEFTDRNHWTELKSWNANVFFGASRDLAVIKCGFLRLKLFWHI